MNNVNIWKSVKIRSLIIANIVSLTVGIILSHDPPICGEKGGLNNHWIFWWAILLLTLQWYNSNASISNSLTAPLKFVTQSETISDGRLFHLMNLSIALMKLSVSNDCTNSICTARNDINASPSLRGWCFLLGIYRSKESYTRPEKWMITSFYSKRS